MYELLLITEKKSSFGGGPTTYKLFEVCKNVMVSFQTLIDYSQVVKHMAAHLRPDTPP